PLTDYARSSSSADWKVSLPLADFRQEIQDAFLLNFASVPSSTLGNGSIRRMTEVRDGHAPAFLIRND
ncbi:MAG: hypothetical protein IJ474_04465, partial [Mailhella sp.]|nr:hypothetical protein [Mailhella sp.]